MTSEKKKEDATRSESEEVRDQKDQKGRFT
jgi:hypothetical protein